MLRRFESFVDKALPLAYATRSPEERRRARLAVAISWIAALCFLIGAVGQANTRNYTVMGADLGLAALIGLAPLAARRVSYPRVFIVTHIMVGAVYLGLIGMAVWVRGGALSAATLNLVLVPVFATWLIGVRAGAMWTVMTITATATLAYLARTGAISDKLEPPQRLIYDHIGLAMLTLVSFSIASFYERRRRHAADEISSLESERHRVEREQVRALGRLAAATAHEINNPLTYISVNLQELAETLPRNAAAQKPIAEALEGVERITQAVARLRHCLPPHQQDLGNVVVADAVAQAVALAEPYTRTRARVEVKVGAVPSFVGDKARIVDVLVSLMLHAAQALPDGQLDRCRIVVSVNHEAGRIVAEVRDDHPMTAQLTPETASVSLALCEGLVRSIGGKLDVDIAPELTVARVTLPLAS